MFNAVPKVRSPGASLLVCFLKRALEFLKGYIRERVYPPGVLIRVIVRVAGIIGIYSFRIIQDIPLAIKAQQPSVCVKRTLARIPFV